jgi:hypothetical protein
MVGGLGCRGSEMEERGGGRKEERWQRGAREADEGGKSGLAVGGPLGRAQY